MPFNPNRINIHELTIEEPEKPSELPFDPEKDITEEDWQEMKNILEIYRQEKNWHYFICRAMEMKILDPTQDLDLNQVAWQGMEDKLKSKANDLGTFFYLAMAIKILDPRKGQNLGLVAWQGMREQTEELRRGGEWYTSTTETMTMKVLDPTQDLNLDSVAWQGMRNELEGRRRKNNSWPGFSKQAERMKILDPTQDLNLDQAAWQGMRDYLELCKRTVNGWFDFSSQAMAMKILAAEEVKVTDNGLEIKMRKDKPLTSTIPPLPETKKF